MNNIHKHELNLKDIVLHLPLLFCFIV